MLPTSAASRVVSVETPSAGEPRAFKGLRRRLLEWRPAQRAAVSVALGASVIFGGARPSFARDSPQPLEHTVEVEQLFLKKKWDRQSCENAGIKVDEIVAKVAWSDMPVGEAQREMFDIVDADLSEDSDRVLGIVTFIGVSSVGVAITTDLFKRFDRWRAAKDREDMQREIDLTGSYVNPYAGDIEEIVDPITGEKKKFEQKNQNRPNIPGLGGEAPTDEPSGGGDDDDSGEGGGIDDVDEQGKSNLDVLKDLL